MKLAVMILLVSSTANAACDQKIYDRLYRSIVVEAIESKQTAEDTEKRNRAIELLRQLCLGQRSSYEGHK